MAVYSVKEFSVLVGIKPSNLSVYNTRGNLLIVNKTIDTSVEKNSAFLEKYRSRNIGKTEEKINVPKNTTPNVPAADDALAPPTQSQSYTESERQLKYLDTLKRKKEIEKLDIDIAKKRGEVIPTELMNPLVLQHNHSITTNYKYVIDDFIRIFSAKYGLNVNEIAEIRGKMTESLNKAIDKTTETTINSIEIIVNQYAEKRGVGERNV